MAAESRQKRAPKEEQIKEFEDKPWKQRSNKQDENNECVRTQLACQARRDQEEDVNIWYDWASAGRRERLSIPVVSDCHPEEKKEEKKQKNRKIESSGLLSARREVSRANKYV